MTMKVLNSIFLIKYIQFQNTTQSQLMINTTILIQVKMLSKKRTRKTLQLMKKKIKLISVKFPQTKDTLLIHSQKMRIKTLMLAILQHRLVTLSIMLKVLIGQVFGKELEDIMNFMFFTKQWSPDGLLSLSQRFLPRKPL